MKHEELKRIWKAEEDVAHIHGWDFSHIEGRYRQEGGLPWEYGALVREFLTPEKKLLDIDTGGGEFLLSLEHPYENTAATEAYAPNAALCRSVLCPLGVDFREARGDGPLPWPDESFDMVINRHGSYCAQEYFRVLRPGGLFITQQVGAMNDRELVDLLCPGVSENFQGHWLADCREECERAGFAVMREGEGFQAIRFFDIGALVWFARIIEWEFVGFSVDTHFERLLEAQEILEKNGSVDGRAHRFMLAARKE
ncbi:MAG: methyltransferase domain-containing protein [Eubacteriales bacterium]|nr:methyltransferase domain-containing protein [Eubacteriales bacterium]